MLLAPGNKLDETSLHTKISPALKIRVHFKQKNKIILVTHLGLEIATYHKSNRALQLELVQLSCRHIVTDAYFHIYNTQISFPAYRKFNVEQHTHINTIYRDFRLHYIVIDYYKNSSPYKKKNQGAGKRPGSEKNKKKKPNLGKCLYIYI